jgi:SAM-dependent methyltransferase
MGHTYSAAWFERFLRPISPAQTAHEAAFVARWLPLPAYTRVLDLACGEGRHAHILAARGYRVTGLDQDAAALAIARSVTGEATFVQADMRHLAQLPGDFDAVISLWQSFGYFDEATNRDILRQIREKLAPHGRLILDLYHRNFFEQNQGTRTLVGSGTATIERKYMAGDRLVVELEYGPDAGEDRFEWQLFTPRELVAMAAELGFRCLVLCSGFDEEMPASPSVPRMQAVFQKQVMHVMSLA